MEDILNFLRSVQRNNNREWFNANKDLYLNAKQKFDNIAQEIIYGVGEFDASCRNLTLKDCTYRFYRDTRFSKDKTPYKTHFGVYVCPKGKKSMWAGYYFHIEPQGANYLGTHMLGCGSYMPDNSMLRCIREEIFSNGENYLSCIKKAKDFYLCKEPALKKLPKEIPTSKYDEYIKLKTQLLEMDIDENFLMDKNLVKNVVKEFKSCYDFVSFINNAISFVGNY